MDARDQPLHTPLEAAWTSAKAQLASGNREIVLTSEIEQAIGQHGVAMIASRFKSMIRAAPSVLRDQPSNVIRILPPPVTRTQSSPLSSSPGPSSSTGSPSLASASAEEEGPVLLPERVAINARAKVAKERMTKVPRPPNAFILYRKHHHPLIKAAHPELHNNEISVIVGKKWQAEAELTKKSFKDTADDLKRKHREEHPSYQYQPRKASERKRRITKTKAAKAVPQSVAQIELPPSPLSPTSSLIGNGTAHHSHGSEFSLSQSSQEPASDQHTFMDFSVPSFEVSEDGNFLFHDFNASQQGQLGALVLKHNAMFDESLHPSSGPAIVSMQPTDHAADEQIYDEALIDWTHLSAEQQQVHEKHLGDVQAQHEMSANCTDKIDPSLYDRRFNTAADYDAWVNGCNESMVARHRKLHEELSDVPRDQWDRMFALSPATNPTCPGRAPVAHANTQDSQIISAANDNAASAVRISQPEIGLTSFNYESALPNNYMQVESQTPPMGYDFSTYVPAQQDVDFTFDYQNNPDFPLNWYDY